MCEATELCGCVQTLPMATLARNLLLSAWLGAAGVRSPASSLFCARGERAPSLGAACTRHEASMTVGPDQRWRLGRWARVAWPRPLSPYDRLQSLVHFGTLSAHVGRARMLRSFGSDGRLAVQFASQRSTLFSAGLLASQSERRCAALLPLRLLMVSPVGSGPSSAFDASLLFLPVVDGEPWRVRVTPSVHASLTACAVSSIVWAPFFEP